MFLLGHWENFDDLEEKLSLDELMATLDAVREKEHREKKFLAALKGIDLDADSKKAAIDRVAAEMARIEAEQENESSPLPPNKDEFSTFGIAVVEGE